VVYEENFGGEQKMKRFVLLLLCLVLLIPAGRNSYARSDSCDFFNPITDVCWWCLFPIRIGGIKITLGYNNIDYSDVGSPICICMTPFPRIGLTLSFWEAVRIAETVQRPWKFPDFCLDLSISGVPTGGTESSSTVNQPRYQWQVHWIAYPVFEMLSLFMDFVCLEHTGFDLGYVSELDPAWNDDFTALFVYPETLLFANQLTEFACLPDRALTAVKQFGLSPLFWCAGNWGSTYPFVKYISETDNPTVSSALAVAKVNAMLHRNFVAKKTIGSSALCGLDVSFTFPKKQYKYQLAKPIRDSTCIPVGVDGVWWTGHKEPITKDTYHSFVIWRKRDCCAF